MQSPTYETIQQLFCDPFIIWIASPAALLATSLVCTILLIVCLCGGNRQAWMRSACAIALASTAAIAGVAAASQSCALATLVTDSLPETGQQLLSNLTLLLKWFWIAPVVGVFLCIAGYANKGPMPWVSNLLTLILTLTCCAAATWSFHDAATLVFTHELGVGADSRCEAPEPVVEITPPAPEPKDDPQPEVAEPKDAPPAPRPTTPRPDGTDGTRLFDRSLR